MVAIPSCLAGLRLATLSSTMTHWLPARAELVKNPLIGLKIGLGHVISDPDIEHRVKQIGYPQGIEYPIGMSTAAVGKNNPGLGQREQRLPELRIRLQAASHIHVVNVMQVILGVDPVMPHESPHGDAVVLPVPPRRLSTFSRGIPTTSCI